MVEYLAIKEVCFVNSWTEFLWFAWVMGYIVLGVLNLLMLWQWTMLPQQQISRREINLCCETGAFDLLFRSTVHLLLTATPPATPRMWLGPIGLQDYVRYKAIPVNITSFFCRLYCYKCAARVTMTTVTNEQYDLQLNRLLMLGSIGDRVIACYRLLTNYPINIADMGRELQEFSLW